MATLELLLYRREPDTYECPQHQELFAELSDEDLVHYAGTTGGGAGQLDAADRRRGFKSDRSQPVRGGFRFLGAAAEAHARGYREELALAGL